MADMAQRIMAEHRRRSRRRELGGAVGACMLLVFTFGTGLGMGRYIWRSREPSALYLGTREFHVAGTELKQYVVSYLRGDKVVEVPTYSPEARDRVIERLGR